MRSLYSLLPNVQYNSTSGRYVNTNNSGSGGLVTQSHRTLVTRWTVPCQAPLSVGFPREECWSGLPFPSPGDLHDPGIEPMSLMSWSITLIIWDENKTRPYCPVMGWMVSPQNLYVAALTSNIIALRYRVFKEIEVKLDHKSRLLIWHSWCLYKKRKRHQRSLFSLSWWT